ncbi:MAG TPA: hypothetical protein VNM92_02935 [Thermoanaerobaculia bacterium]|nr:hypothetical protein [Thermoanaerobaculia bacterium]
MRVALALATAFIPLALSAGVVEVKLKLPIKPKLNVTGDETIAIAPFVIVASEEKGRPDRASKVDLQAEFARYLRKQINKSTKLKLVDLPPTRLPSTEIKLLEANRDFWKDLASRSGADLLITGVIDFDVRDKAGYKTEEYVSQVDGRTYYRQVLVESTGFIFDIVVAVFNGDTGEKIAEENFRDFKEFDQRNYDEILGLFENLRALETQLLGLFVAQESSATRYVFTN